MLVYFAVSLIALLGFCGLALDVGRMEARSLQLQTAADNAAISYALEYGRRGNVASSTLTAMASNELTAYAAANNLPLPTITLQSGASSGPYAGNSAVIQATIQQTMPTTLLGILSSGSKSIQFSRSAVAAMPPCSTFYTTLQFLANSKLTLNCPLSIGTSLNLDGSSQIAGSHLLIAANSSPSNINGLVSPAPIFNWPSETHPFSYFSYVSSGNCHANNLNVNTPTTLSPGEYCNDTTINNTTVTLQPGYYYMQGNVNISHATITGGPVTMVLAKDSSGHGQFFFDNSIWLANAPTTPDASGSHGIFLVCVVPIGASNTWGNHDVQFTHSTVTADGMISCGLSGVNIDNSTLGDAGHFFSLTFNEGNITNSTITLTNDYSQLPGGSPAAFTVNILQ